MSQTVKPGYKQTEIGVIPEEWGTALVGEIAQVEGGYAFSSKQFLSNGKYQVVKMSNLYGGHLDLDRSASFLESITAEQARYLLRANDVIITLTGTTGKRDYGYSYIVHREENLLLNQRVGRLVVSDLHSAIYVAYQIKTPCFLNQFYELSKGGTGNQTNVGTQDVAAMRIPVPPLKEQRAIAEALSDVDALLAALDRLIAKQRDLKQAAMQQLLTGQTRLPGFVGKWATACLNEVATRTAGFWGLEHCDEGHQKYVEVIRAGDISPDGKLTTTAPRYFSEAEFAKARCCLGDVVITGSGSVGKIWWCDGRSDVAASNFVRILRPISQRVNGLFLSQLLRSDGTQRLMVEHIATGVMANLGSSFFNTKWLKLPPLPEQTAIATVLSDMDLELAALEQRRDKTRALKQGMMQELLTGRTRLI